MLQHKRGGTAPAQSNPRQRHKSPPETQGTELDATIKVFKESQGFTEEDQRSLEDLKLAFKKKSSRETFNEKTVSSHLKEYHTVCNPKVADMVNPYSPQGDRKKREQKIEFRTR